MSIFETVLTPFVADVIPPRCRKPRTIMTVGVTEVEVPHVEVELAAVVLNTNGPVTVYYSDGESLYSGPQFYERGDNEKIKDNALSEALARLTVEQCDKSGDYTVTVPRLSLLDEDTFLKGNESRQHFLEKVTQDMFRNRFGYDFHNTQKLDFMKDISQCQVVRHNHDVMFHETYVPKISFNGMILYKTGMPFFNIHVEDKMSSRSEIRIVHGGKNSYYTGDSGIKVPLSQCDVIEGIGNALNKNGAFLETHNRILVLKPEVFSFPIADALMDEFFNERFVTYCSTFDVDIKRFHEMYQETEHGLDDALNCVEIMRQDIEHFAKNSSHFNKLERLKSHLSILRQTVNAYEQPETNASLSL